MNSGQSIQEKQEKSTHFERSITRKVTKYLPIAIGSGKQLVIEEEYSLEDIPCQEVLDFDQVKSYGKYLVGCNIDKILKRFNPIEKQKITSHRLSRLSLLGRL